MIAETVNQKLRFSENRLNDLESLIANNQLASHPESRHQLTQEFFFHLIGATEYLAQLINERFLLQIERVAVYKVIDKLKDESKYEKLICELELLCANTKKDPFPRNPYSDRGLIYRVINYRNEVSHRAMNPFHFISSAGPKVGYFWLDPRDTNLGKSENPVDLELRAMYDLVNAKCQESLSILVSLV